MQKKSFDTPDETFTPPKSKTEVIKVGDKTVMRSTFEPGWKWSEHIKPLAGTDSCHMHHVIYAVSGHLHVVADDGTELEVGPGEVVDIPPGHDAWVVGDEPVVGIDFAGNINSTKSSE